MREIIDIQRLQEKVLEKNREIIEENEFCSKVAKLWVASKGTSEQFMREKSNENKRTRRRNDSPGKKIKRENN